MKRVAILSTVFLGLFLTASINLVLAQNAKKNDLIFGSKVSIDEAQYPPPRDFYHSIGYIPLSEMGYCNGKTVLGPTYCSNFSWDAPDISDEDIQLVGYNVYHFPGDMGWCEKYEEGMEMPSLEEFLLAHTKYTYLELEGTYTGINLVTALYSDGGESEPNIINSCNIDIPLSINDIKNQKFTLSYNSQTKGFEIKGIEDNTSVAVFRTDGTRVMFVSSINSNFISLKSLEKGVYIVQVTTKDFQTISDKIVIE